MKRFLALLGILTAALFSLCLFSSCAGGGDGGETTGNPANESDAAETGPVETEPAEVPPTAPSLGFDLTSSSASAPDDAVKVEEIESKYIASRRDGITVKVGEPHIEIDGAPYFEQNGGRFFRLLYSDYSKYPSAVANHALKGSGVRLRFRTDSPTVKVNVTYAASASASANRSVSANCGLDVYLGTGADKVWAATVVPEIGKTTAEGTFAIEGGMKDVTVELPYFSEVSQVTFTFANGSNIASPTPYTYTKPVVFYGSSITHGIAATKPANAYPAILSRVLDTDYINLGFSGAAKGETVMAEFIAGLDMSVFVYDYDYNAANVSDLRATHYDFYKTVRDAHPDTPIILMTKCNVAMSDYDSNAERRAVIKATYDRALSEGDKNIYYIDGKYVYPEIGRDLCRGDGTHPDDTGFWYMASAVYPVLKALLEGTDVPAETVKTTPDQFFANVASTLPNSDADAIAVNDVGEPYYADKRLGVGIKPTEPHIEVTGLPGFEADGSFSRLTGTEGASEGAKAQAALSAGGRIRFRTDSKKLSVLVRFASSDAACAFASGAGANGMDAYMGTGTGKTWLNTFQADAGTRSYTYEISLTGSMTDVTINLPICTEISSLVLYFDKGSKLASPTPYEIADPVVFAGSSVLTHDDACRPGTAAAELSSRALGANLYDLGLAEEDGDYALLVKAVENASLSAFVYAYGGENADAEAHYAVYTEFRKTHPDAPFVFFAGSAILDKAGENAVSSAMKEAYKKARAAGDEKVAFLDGAYVLPETMRDLCSADGQTLNDLGHYFLAKAYCETLSALFAN